ncbi:hypothetical protein F7R25_04165 [Burkholderia stagnalis]|uniref:Uncharacterized protein n=1 Tax=Burkholderia stagnalis TaxID=1503054 RepID=A0A6L3N3P2_9BURK|nr:hypothetical protein [Burkholderia stagnalis]KAB0640700.1 hypothetical protein F7R25_04165 [Burkholderia stagnalis]VWB06735.1 hypothetical protein BST28156_00139 [Burkholderia stagnalis]
MNKTQITIEDMDRYFQQGRSKMSVPVKALSEDLHQKLMAFGAKPPLFQKLGLGLRQYGDEESVLVPNGLLEEYKANRSMELIDIEKVGFYAMMERLYLQEKLESDLGDRSTTSKKTKI